MKRLTLMTLTLLAAPTGALAWPSCTIVTDGSDSAYWHEIAHCNGWVHEPFIEIDPPERYVYTYDGILTHLLPTDGETVKSLCLKLWRKQGLTVTAKQIGPNRLVGCAAP